MEDAQPYREDDLDNELAAHINSRTASLALSAEEKQVIVNYVHILSLCNTQ